LKTAQDLERAPADANVAVPDRRRCCLVPFHHDFRLKTTDLFYQPVELTVRPQSNDAAVIAHASDDIERLHPDGAGRTEDNNPPP
jgi:hypothetical protein